MQNILLLHGALGTHEDLQPLEQSLKKAGFTLHTFSFSGHGKTGFNQNFDVKQFSDEVVGFIVRSNIQELSIFGYSMGGYVALNLALLQQPQIKKIITLGTKFDWNDHAVEKETKLLDPEKIAEKLPAYAKILEAKHGEKWKILLHKTSDLMRNINSVQYLNPVALKKIAIPVLLGIADGDQMISLDETTMVYRNLQKGAMFMLPNTRHQLETTNTSLLSHIITDFIRT